MLLVKNVSCEGTACTIYSYLNEEMKNNNNAVLVVELFKMKQKTHTCNACNVNIMYMEKNSMWHFFVLVYFI